MAEGIVYALTNPAMPGLVKIGKTSLTKITSAMLGTSYQVQPTRYWTYKGRNLRDIYDETYTSKED